MFVLQDESNTTNLSVYDDSLYSTAASQARAANSSVAVYSEVSTANGTAAQMTAAALPPGPLVGAVRDVRLWGPAGPAPRLKL